MTCKIAIYCLLLVALIGLISAAPRKSNFCSTNTFVLALFLNIFLLKLYFKKTSNWKIARF